MVVRIQSAGWAGWETHWVLTMKKKCEKRPTVRWIFGTNLVFCSIIILAAMRENLSSGFPTKWDSNRPAKLQRLARKLKFRLLQVWMWYFPKSEKTKALISLHCLVWACVVRNPLKPGFLATRPIQQIWS